VTDSKRLFVGARVSVATANALAGAAETLARRARDARLDLRWVAPVSYHLTLKFLGNTHEATIPAVRDALDRATVGTPRIQFRTTRLGAFPSLDQARVIWAGVEEQSGALAALANRIEEGCAALGFARDRGFHPHITIARARETRPIREVVLPMAEQMFGDTRIEAITLFESETKSSGSVHRELCRIAFKTAELEASEASKRQSGALELVDESLDTDDGWPRGHVPNT
jgi:RNA 2',3'-cyclic 3'-phosphodiesterase